MARPCLLACVLLLLWVPAAAATHDGPLAAQWHLDVSGATTPDSSGHGLAGTMSEHAGTPGRFANAMTFPFSASGVVVADSPRLEPARVSLIAWVRRDGPAGPYQYIAAKGAQAPCNASSYGLITSEAGGLQFYVSRALGVDPVLSPSPAPDAIWDDRWHGVAGVFDGARARLFVDGVEVGAGTPAAAPIGYGLTDDRFTIGRYPRQEECGAQFGFTGAVDEVRVYDRALSSTELRRLLTAPGQTPPTLEPDPSAPPDPTPAPPPSPPDPPSATAPGSPPADTAASTRGPSVIAVATAAPMVAGRVAMLTARTDLAAQRLEWDLDADGRSEVSCPGDQPSLRFRLPGGAPSPRASQLGRRVAVRAVGSAGVGEPRTQPFAVAPAPAAPASAALRRVVGAVATREPVYACGAVSASRVVALELGDKASDTVVNRRQLESLTCTDRTIVSGTLRISGCLTPIRTETQIPTAERASLKPVIDIAKVSYTATKQGAAPSEGRFVELALDLTDAYISAGPVVVNGMQLAPQGSARVVLFPQVRRIFSSDAKASVGGIPLEHPQKFSLNTVAANAAGRIPVGSFTRGTGGLTKLGGFTLAGDVSVVLTPDRSGVPAGAEITTRLKLPSFLGGAESRVKLRVTAVGEVLLDALRIGPISASLGPVGVEGLQLDYSGETREWRGAGQLCLSFACIDARDVPGRPPPGGVVIRDGKLTRLYVNVLFPGQGITLFPGVQLNRIGAGLGLDPTRLLGSARVTALGIIEVDGALVLAFPSAAAPFRLTREEAGGAFPPEFYARPYPRAALAVGADAFLKVPLIDQRVRLGGAYFLYHFPGYVAFGGGLDYDFFGVVQARGRTDGEFNAENGRFNLGGTVRVCLADIICRGSVMRVSSVGVGACVEFGPLNIGGGVRYSPFKVLLWPIDGCKWSRFYEPNVFRSRISAPTDFGARPVQAGASHRVRISDGDPSRAVRLDGVDGAPRVTVTAPGGQRFQSTPGAGLELGPKVRIMRSERLKATVVGLQDPEPGTYTIEPAPDSPAVTRITEAEDPPDARITARVRGRGVRRTLSYDIGARPDQRVTFVEVSPEGNRPIATVAGGRGSVAFSPAPGGGRRTIEAQFELAGMRAETRVVARFTPPSARLGRPARVIVRRRGRALRVSWTRVAGATGYEVVATSTAGGQQRVRTRAVGVSVRRVARSSGGRVSVVATAPLRRGSARSVLFRAVASRAGTRFGPLTRLTGAR